MGNLPQYMKSTDPEIIATVERRMEAFWAWRKQAFEWAAKITGLPEKDVGIRINGWSNDQVLLVGFYPWQVEGIDLPGGWTKDPVRPKKNNPIYKDYAKIATYKAEKVPGRPNTASGDGYWGGGSLFVHDGAAYSGFGFIPEGLNSHDQGEGWEEIRASEYMAAKEAHEDARKANKEN